MKKNKSKKNDLFDEKNVKKKRRAGKKTPANSKKNSDLFNFDDEIVIGVKKTEDKPKSKKVSTKPKSKNYKNEKEAEKKQKKMVHVLEALFIFIILIAAGLFMFLSPVFDIKKISIKGNSKVTEQEILSLSSINLEENTFTYRMSEIAKNVKRQPYIEDVKVKRILPSEIEIEVSERTPSFMIAIGNAFAYISNQGYFLEISETKLEIPILVGYETKLEEIIPGARLMKEDLQKLEILLHIMESAKNNELADKITQINIEDKNNIVLFLENDMKTVYFGDIANLNTKMMYLKKILTEEEGEAAEVFLNVDLNKENVYIRYKI